MTCLTVEGTAFTCAKLPWTADPGACSGEPFRYSAGNVEGGCTDYTLALYY